MTQVKTQDFDCYIKSEALNQINQDIDKDSGHFGKWDINQNLKYVIFLHKNKSRFCGRLRRKKIKLYEQMADFIGTRSATQCRTHHQKYYSKFQNVKTIIEIYKNQIGPKTFKRLAKTMYVTKNKENEKKQISFDQEQSLQKGQIEERNQVKPLNFSYQLPYLMVICFPNQAYFNGVQFGALNDHV